VQLRLPRLQSKPTSVISSLLSGLPFKNGSPILVSIKPELTAHRGKLLSGRSQTGTPVYAASFIRERRIILEAQLFTNEQLLRLVLAHELFHFVWPRLGNPTRASFANLLAAELKGSARGELGESAAVSKEILLASPANRRQDRRFLHYLCEAFCDTGAFLFAGVRVSAHFTLAPRWIVRRTAWFREAIDWKLRCY
jgi:hypothetical protein